MAKRYCSFCGRDESQCSSLFQGLHGELLCGDCVRLMASELTGATTGGKTAEEPAAEAERLRRYIIRYDTIRPAHPELPYGQGKEGFKAPAEWRVTKP